LSSWAPCTQIQDDPTYLNTEYKEEILSCTWVNICVDEISEVMFLKIVFMGSAVNTLMVWYTKN
jgi:hypothetical protein